MRPTIYIAGPMRGYPNFNREAFNEAARRLADAGWQPINPVDIERIYPCEDEDGKVDAYRLHNLMIAERAFVERCAAIYLLDGWETSIGAKGELCEFLKRGGIAVFLESNGTPETPSMGGVQ